MLGKQDWMNILLTYLKMAPKFKRQQCPVRELCSPRLKRRHKRRILQQFQKCSNELADTRLSKHCELQLATSGFLIATLRAVQCPILPSVKTQSGPNKIFQSGFLFYVLLKKK